MKRRDALKAAVGAAGAAALLPVSTVRAAPMASAKRTSNSDASPLRNRLLNMAQAQAVMEEYDLAGMIALNPVNVFYLTNTECLIEKMGVSYPAFATLPRDASQPTYLVHSVAETLGLANYERWSPETIPFSGGVNGASYTGENSLPLSVEPDAYQFGYYVNRDVPLTDREQAWVSAQERTDTAPSAEWALARALKQSGIVRGRVAVDDMRVAILLKRIGQAENIEFVEGDNFFRKIRYVKSPTEIDIMRIAASRNADAAAVTALSIEAGFTHDDINRIFLEEAAKRGNSLTFCLAGFATGGLPDGVVREGKPFLIDAVSDYENYHGDFARTIIIGELDKNIRQMVKAQAVAREAIFEILKPGLKYSQIRETGKSAFKKAGGKADAFIVNPHSVGLQHTDQPYSDTSPWRAGVDLELKAGMTITVDLPYLEIGVGSGHHEDLLVVTENGFKRLTSEYPDVIYA